MLFDALFKGAKGVFKGYQATRKGNLTQMAGKIAEHEDNLLISNWGKEGAVRENIKRRTTDMDGNQIHGGVHKTLTVAEEILGGVTRTAAEGTGAVIGGTMGAMQNVAGKIISSGNGTIGRAVKQATGATLRGVGSVAAPVAGTAARLTGRAAWETTKFVGRESGKLALDVGVLGADAIKAGWKYRNHAATKYGIYAVGAGIAAVQFNAGVSNAELDLKLQNTSVDSNGGGTFISDSFNPSEVDYSWLRRFPNQQDQQVDNFNATGELVHALHALR